jgi:hypothetical protein
MNLASPLVWGPVPTDHKGSLASTGPKDVGSISLDPLGTGSASLDPLGAKFKIAGY